MISRSQRRRWLLVAGAVAGFVALLALIDYYTGTDLIGGTARFMWRIVVAAGEMLLDVLRLGWRYLLVVLEYSWRVFAAFGYRLYALLPALLSSRLTRIVWLLSMGAAAGMYFGRRKADGSLTYWQKLRRAIARASDALKEWWLARHLVTKCFVVVLAIAVQVHLHWAVVLFPVGFMIPYLVMALNALQRTVLAPVVDVFYFRYFGRWHAHLKQQLAHNASVRPLIELARLFKLWFETGWRLWYYDPRYAFPDWKPIWRETAGRLVFIFSTIIGGDWNMRRLHRRPLLGGGFTRRSVAPEIGADLYKAAS